MRRLSFLLLAGTLLLLGLALVAVNLRRHPAPSAPLRSAPIPEGFYLQDGDRVLFLGDSITEQRLYTTYVETYCVTRFPRNRFEFIHCGWSGDRVHVGTNGPMERRLMRDVYPYKPNVVTICLGMNDGNYAPLRPYVLERFKRRYRDLMNNLIRNLPGVRITLMTPPAYDETTRSPKFPGGYASTLKALIQEIGVIGREYGALVVDVQTPMLAALRELQRRYPDRAKTFLPDRVHPSPGGHLLIAAALLKAWNAPATVADITVDGRAEAVKTVQAEVVEQRFRPDGVTFMARDGALPWPLDPSEAAKRSLELACRVSATQEALNRYRLRVTGLTHRSYRLMVDGREIGRITRKQIEAGLDLTTLPGHPANRQAQQVFALNQQHNDLFFACWRKVMCVPGPDGLPSAETWSKAQKLLAQEAAIVGRERAAAQPLPHRIELRAVGRG